MGRVALIGSNGQLGTDIMRLWPAGRAASAHEIIGLVRSDLDIRSHDQIRSVLNGIQPAVVINTAAFHRVDDCERSPEEAFATNAFGLKNLAEACRDLDCTLVHMSTDYVFSGAGRTPYVESSALSPISSYGVSKAAGEYFTRYILPDKHLIVRSSGLFGTAGASGKGGNFIETMLRLAQAGRPIRVVSDQVLSPTYTSDLAERIIELVALGSRGTFHVTNSGHCSWYEFASEIFRQRAISPDFAPTTSAEYGAAAPRPPFSVLASERLSEVSLAELRDWRSALADYLSSRS